MTAVDFARFVELCQRLRATPGRLDKLALLSDYLRALPVDAILMELARAYVQKGNREEARKAFTELVDKHPQSPYTSEARTELENLKG